jgi:hypothetical protein
MPHIQLTLNGNGTGHGRRDEGKSVARTGCTIGKPRSERNRRTRWWFAIAYPAVFLPFLFLLTFAWMRPDFNRQEIPDWKPVLALAEASLERFEASLLDVF